MKWSIAEAPRRQPPAQAFVRDHICEAGFVASYDIFRFHRSRFGDNRTRYLLFRYIHAALLDAGRRQATCRTSRIARHEQPDDMPYYRIYLLSEDDRIDDVREAHCTSDEEAIAAARGLIGDYPAVEIWTNGRLVGRFRAEA
jgi:hypothetical protein